MGKANKERQAKQREKLKKYEKAYREYLSKDWMRKKSKRSEDKKKPNQNRMHSRLLRELNSRSKHKEKKTAANVTLPHALPFQTSHSTKKTMKHALESLPNSSRKKMFVIVKMAIKAAIEIKGNLRKKVS